VYPAAWPQAKKHPFVQPVFKGYETISGAYVKFTDAGAALFA
jgi:hypothetical protein